MWLMIVSPHVHHTKQFTYVLYCIVWSTPSGVIEKNSINIQVDPWNLMASSLISFMFFTEGYLLSKTNKISEQDIDECCT